MRKTILKDAIAAGALAAALALHAGGAQAQQQNPVSGMLGRIFGFQDEQPAINYSERAPLVIPAKRDLVNITVCSRKTRCLYHRCQGGIAVLSRAPNLAFVGRVESRRVHRLHRRVVLVRI